VRRRGIRQNGGGDPRGVQGRELRPTGRRAGPDDAPRPAALRYVPGAAEERSRARGASVPIPDRRRAADDSPRAQRRQRGYRHRHAPSALGRRGVQSAGAPRH
jgi:hypothetical protein